MPGLSRDRLILHVGLPKAASSALQFWCDGQRERLAAEGVDYPDPRSEHPMKKHHALVPELLKGRADTLARDVAESRAPTMLVSNEGFAPRYRQFPRAAADALAGAAGGRAVTLFLLTRSEEGWLRSIWAQRIINPSIQRAPLIFDTFDDFVRRSDARWLLDVEARGAEMQAIAQADQVVRASVEEDWFGALLTLLGVARRPGDAPPRIHGAAPPHAIEIVRRVNALPTDQPNLVRSALLAGLQAELGTSNVTLANTARVFATHPNEKRKRSSSLLANALRDVDPDPGPMAALHAAISAWAERGMSGS